jgi:magnesium transporter
MLTRYGRGDVIWVDCIAPTPSEMRSLMHEFNIDPGLAEELLVPSFRPKVERRGDVVYVVLHFPLMHGMRHGPGQEVDFLIGKQFLITTRYESVDPLHSFAKAFAVETVLGRPGTSHGGHLFIEMVQNLYRALIEESGVLEGRLREIEEHIFSGDERRMVAQLSQVGRIVHDFRQALGSHGEMLSSLESAGARFFGVEFSYHARALIESYRRVERRVESLRDSLTELRETNNSLLSTKQNEIMKSLTVVAFFFLPLSFISSLFSMNAQHIPLIGIPYDFWIIVGGMTVIALSFFLYFHHKKWL